MTFHYFTDNQISPLYISAILIVCSIIFFQKGKTKISLFFLFIGSLGLGYFIANLDPFLILWDEQYHALVAKNLVKNPLKPTLYSNPILGYDYRNWTENFIWLHKQPLFLWQMALSVKLFGLNTLAVRLPSIILHALTVLLIYRIGKISHSERIGYYGGLFFAFSYYILELVSGKFSTDHNDIAFLFYVASSFWAWFEYKNCQKKYFLVLIGLSSGFAVLVKWLVGLLIYAIWFISIGVNDKREFLKIKSYWPMIGSLFITLLVFIPWQVYILIKYPLESSYEFAYNTKHFFEPIETHSGNLWFHFKAIENIYGSGDAVPYLYLLGLVIYLKKVQLKIYRVATVSAILITYLFFTIATTKMISFCIIVSPFVFLGLASLIDAFLTGLSNRIKLNQFEMLFRPIVLIIICYFLLDIPKIQNYHTDWKPNDNCDRALEKKEMEFIHKAKTLLGIEDYVVFNVNISVNGHIPFMFYTNYTAYNYIPSESQIRKIESNHYKIAIWDNNDLPKYITDKEDIVKIKM